MSDININRFVLQELAKLWMVSDCEELVGLLAGDDCVFCKCFNLLAPNLLYKAPQ